MFKEIDPTELQNMNAFRAVGKEWFLITAEADGVRNAMTASWGFLGNLWNKNAAVCFVRPQRFTHNLTEKADRVSLCFFGDGYRAELGKIFPPDLALRVFNLGQVKRIELTPDMLPVGAIQPDTEDLDLSLAVMKLPRKMREAIILYYYQDMSTEEIAETLGIAQSSVSNRLRRGREKLRKMLEGRDQNA